MSPHPSPSLRPLVPLGGPTAGEDRPSFRSASNSAVTAIFTDNWRLCASGSNPIREGTRSPHSLLERCSMHHIPHPTAGPGLTLPWPGVQEALSFLCLDGMEMSVLRSRWSASSGITMMWMCITLPGLP